MDNNPNHPIYTPTTSTTITTSTITVAHQNTTLSNAANRPTYTSASTTTYANACAACRFQRRKCTETCPLAPYFPVHKQQEFMNVHKLFGVNNIIKTLNSAPPEDRDDAMTALIYTANARAHDPVHGCIGIIQSLTSQIAFYNDQLNAVLVEIAALRTAAQVHGVQDLEALPLSAYFSEAVRDSEGQPSIISNRNQAQLQRRFHENLLQDNQPIADLINEAETANQLELENTDVQVQNVAANIKFEYTSDENPEPRIVEQKPAKRKSENRFEQPKNKRNPFDDFDGYK